MKHLLMFSALFLLSIKALAVETVSAGYKASLKSAVLAEVRDYYVSLPPGYDASEDTYPVVYVLDGDVHRWKAISGMIEGLSTDTLDNQIIEAIVVAIPNTDRDRDLTPTRLAQWTFEGKVLQTFETSGGADNFQTFLSDELIPKIEAMYRCSGQRILIGESFGGLFASYSLLTKPSLFTDYLIIDPAALWDNNYLNRRLQRKAKPDIHPTPNVYFAFANNAHLKNIGVTNREWGERFASALQSDTTINYNVTQRYFEKETHNTVALSGWYHGLRLLLAPQAVEDD